MSASSLPSFALPSLPLLSAKSLQGAVGLVLAALLITLYRYLRNYPARILDCGDPHPTVATSVLPLPECGPSSFPANSADRGLLADHESLQTRRAHLLAHNSQLQASVSSTKASIAQLLPTLLALRRTKRSLETQVAQERRAHASLQAVHAHLRGAQHALLAAQLTLSNVDKQAARIRAQATMLEQETLRNRAAVEHARAENASRSARLGELEREKEGLQVRLRALRADVSQKSRVKEWLEGTKNRGSEPRKSDLAKPAAMRKAGNGDVIHPARVDVADQALTPILVRRVKREEPPRPGPVSPIAPLLRPVPCGLIPAVRRSASNPAPPKNGRCLPGCDSIPSEIIDECIMCTLKDALKDANDTEAAAPAFDLSSQVQEPTNGHDSPSVAQSLILDVSNISELHDEVFGTANGSAGPPISPSTSAEAPFSPILAGLRSPVAHTRIDGQEDGQLTTQNNDGTEEDDDTSLALTDELGEWDSCFSQTRSSTAVSDEIFS